MATETVVSDHSSTSELAEKEAHEELKTIEHKSASPPKESGEQEKLKSEKLPSPAVPSAEPKEKIKAKQSEPPVVEEVKKSDEEEKPKADSPSAAVTLAESEGQTVDKQSEPIVEEVKKNEEEEKPKADSPSPAVPSAESEEKIEEKQIECTLIEEKKKTDDTPNLDVTVEENSEAAKDSIPEPDAPNILEPAADNAKIQPEEQPVTEHVEKPQEVSTKESAEEKAEEQAKIIDVPESSVEAVEKKEEQVQVKVEKNEETAAYKVEDTRLVKEEETSVEGPIVTGSSDQVTSTIEDPQVDPKGGGECHPADVAEVASTNDKEGGEADMVEGLPKEEVVGKVEAEKEAKNVRSEEKSIEKNGVIEESTQPETKKFEDVTSSIFNTEVLQKCLEGENTSQDIEVSAENGKRENIKDETLASVETNKDGEVEGTADEVKTTTAEEPVDEPQKSETEMKGEETVETGETKLEKEKAVDDTAKPGVHNPESTKDGDDTKTSQDPPKEEVSVKSTQKQSNNIIAKVKQSLVKAKKAIIGKSPNSKPPSAETKGDVKVK